jgi:hypothetical protein
MVEKSNKKVYVRAIEGIPFGLPLPVRHLDGDKYLILDTNEFDPDDSSCLLEFLPGDIVRVKGEYAVEMISTTAKDREYWALLFRIAWGEDSSAIVRHQADYTNAIARITHEVDESVRWHYPAVREWVERHRDLGKQSRSEQKPNTTN